MKNGKYCALKRKIKKVLCDIQHEIGRCLIESQQHRSSLENLLSTPFLTFKEVSSLHCRCAPEFKDLGYAGDVTLGKRVLFCPVFTECLASNCENSFECNRIEKQ